MHKLLVQVFNTSYFLGDLILYSAYRIWCSSSAQKTPDFQMPPRQNSVHVVAYTQSTPPSASPMTPPTHCSPPALHPTLPGHKLCSSDGMPMAMTSCHVLAVQRPVQAIPSSSSLSVLEFKVQTAGPFFACRQASSSALPVDLKALICPPQLPSQKNCLLAKTRS